MVLAPRNRQRMRARRVRVYGVPKQARYEQLCQDDGLGVANIPALKREPSVVMVGRAVNQREGEEIPATSPREELGSQVPRA